MTSSIVLDLKINAPKTVNFHDRMKPAVLWKIFVVCVNVTDCWITKRPLDIWSHVA